MRNHRKKFEVKTPQQIADEAVDQYAEPLARICAEAEEHGIDAGMLYASIVAEEESQRSGQSFETVLARLLATACFMLSGLTPPPSAELIVNG